MKKRKRWTLVGLAALLGAFLSFPVGAAKDGLEDAKNKMTALEQEKEKTEAVLKQLEGLKSDTAAYVKQLDTQLESLGDALLQLESDILAKEELIAVRQAELEEARQVEKNQYESMKLRIKYMYEKGESSYLDLLMESGSLSELLNRAEYITKISEYDRRQLDVYAATKERIAEAEKVLEAEHAVLLTMQEETEAKQASVEQLLATKQAELSEYENRITAAEGQLSEYQKDIEAQERAIQAIEAEIKRQEEEARRKAAEAGKSYKTISLGDIKFIWPCPASSRITSGFGGRSSPTEGASSNHQGIDIGAASGSDIVAAASGEVVVSTYSYSAGNYVMVSHGGGVYTVYMHASKLLVSAGDSVQQGQVIAKVGSTGYSTGPHLHFGVRLNGTYVNPSQYVSP